ncbi:MAG: DUF3644 domain-containing protein [Candidatus Microgenomates bacterium]
MPQLRITHSEKIDLIQKSREAMLSAVQIYNNPLTLFKSETFIVLSMIAWIYLLHAYYRSIHIDYRYSDGSGRGKRYVRNPDGSIKYWDLRECIIREECPLDENTKNNLLFLIGLRNQIEHKKATGLDSFMSARYQACALNYNFFLKKLHGDKYRLDNNLALSLQFAELDFNQAQIIKDKEKFISKDIISYISGFDNRLTAHEIKSERFAYRLLFAKVNAKRIGQADRVIEFIDPKSQLAKTISKEYWVIKNKKSKPYLVRQVISELAKRGFKIGYQQHIKLWKKYDGKNPTNGFGVLVGSLWYWYQDWIDFLSNKLKTTHAE